MINYIFIADSINSGNTYFLPHLFFEVGNLFAKTFLKRAFQLCLVAECVQSCFSISEINKTSTNIFL